MFSDPLPMPDAWQRVARWLAVKNVWNPAAGERHAGILAELLGGPAASPKLVSGAHLAALAIEHGLVLCSTDGDFARFPTLRWENPLA